MAENERITDIIFNMDNTTKHKIFVGAKKHTEEIRGMIKQEIKQTEIGIEKNKTTLKEGVRADQQLSLMSILRQQKISLEQLNQLYPSPYFVRCDVFFDNKKKQEIIYFAKFSFSDQAIYSWVAPVSVIRFEKPGDFSYSLPNGQHRFGRLVRKDQFMIVNGKIIFMSSESLDQPRTLIYQEVLSRKKTEFVLPEIIELMEKAQDTVIRAHYQGPFLIAGPAGSGKTTLALHRVAYLIQSPDLADKFDPHKIIVFVQDKSTKQYFGALLPDLGINNVKITTFSEWALTVLKINNAKFVNRYGDTEKERDLYEYSKNQALKNLNKVTYVKNIFENLENFYNDYFSAEQIKILKKQKKEIVLDRFDLTILLRAWLNSHQTFITENAEYQGNKNFKIRKKIVKVPLKYSLVIIDEIENYLAEQIKIINSTVDKKTNALIFVGDLAQKSALYTIKNWREVEESFETERMVNLEKIYRNTKQILKYIKSLGYKIEIPQGIKEGAVVQEKICRDKDEEIECVREIVNKNKKTIIGVLAKNPEYLKEFKNKFTDNKNIKILTINEAQGVEFDIVCLVGLNKEFFIKHSNLSDYPPELIAERMRVDYDLLYLALTRAMNELYVIGNQTLKDLIALSAVN